MGSGKAPPATVAASTFFLFYLIGAVDANVLRFFEAIFAKKVRFFLRNDGKAGN